jgi:triphosphoribosyl-dephospho-CoA synthase
MTGEADRCAASIAAAFVAACRDELAAPKPGNVHVFADGHRMTAADFMRSAQAAAGPLTEPGVRVGRRIREAVAATFAAVGMNTNLGIVLLGAPLAAAAEAGGDLEPALARVLDGLDIADADDAFRAIVQASPGGLGRAERHDVRAPATVTLQAAMAEAAGRDRIARQYATNYGDVFAVGEPALVAALAQGWDTPFATLAVYLAFLASAPDSHVVRKHGLGRAEDLQAEATRWHGRLRGCADPQALLPELLRWDAALKADAINPGTSADLTVATLFAHRLRSTLPSAGNSA